uniref:Erythroferrone n=1 Tax=Camelus bactrianus TaxID=9837 RepID=A0A9W3HD73_CAMBA|nr:erythroferrone [Camelus bactrianus]
MISQCWTPLIPLTARDKPPAKRCLLCGAHREGKPTCCPAVFQEPSSERAHSIDPRDAWMLFVRQSDRGVNSKRGSRGKARKFELGLPGPPGPPGPQGPPGPIIPPEVLLKEFQLLLKGRGYLSCWLQSPMGGTRKLLSGDREDSTHPPLRVKFMRVILSIFLWHTGSEGTRFPLYPGTELVSLFWFPSEPGLAIPGFGPGLPFLALVAHLRLCGLNFLLLGTQFRCTSTRRPGQDSPSHGTLLGVGSWGDVSTWWVELVGLGQGSLADPLSVGHSSLEAVTGLESSSELFTVSVNGVLYLQTGQYTSVFLDNASGSSLTVRSGSHFSGVLLGV